MQTLSKRMQPQAGYSTGVMETETIQKNGASPKSPIMNRGKFLMMLMIFAYLFAVDAYSWVGNGTSSNPWQIANGGGSGVTAYLSGSTLYINGSGNMADFWESTEGDAPWYASRSSIITVVIQNGVANIGDIAFRECANLKSITIPASVTIIGKRAFENCTGLQSMTIPNNVRTIEGRAFSGAGITTLDITAGTIPLHFERFYNHNRNGDLYDATYPTGYHYHWFYGCPIQTLNLGRNYTFNTETPFQGKFSLQTLTIGTNVTELGELSFGNCGSLNNVTIANSTNVLTFKGISLGGTTAGCFYNSPITTVHLGRNIGFETTNTSRPCWYAFRGNTGLKNLTVGETVNAIPDYMFQGCTGLTSVTLPNSIITIGSYAFNGCSALTSITIPNSVTTIGSYAFSSCRGLTSVNIPSASTAVAINNSAFESCSSLPSITIPVNVTELGELSFGNCGSLNNVTIANSTNVLTFKGISLGGTTAGCFYNSPITTVHLGRNIGFETTNTSRPCWYAFRGNTGLKNLTVGETVNVIPDYMFQGCNSLAQITSNAAIPPVLGANTFSGVTGIIPVNVPCAMAYQASAWGTAFSNLIQTGSCPTPPVTYTLEVLSSDITKGHATATSLASGFALTSTFTSADSNFPIHSVTTLAQFSGKALLTAGAKTNSVFLGWSDGNLEPVRIVDVTANASYTARFADCSGSGIESVQADASLRVYPNPASAVVSVELDRNTTDGILALFDMNGRVVKTQDVMSMHETIDLSHFTSGNYILRLVEKGVATATVKIVKE
ncbi:MAG: leucine-rich repeat domain-containing protein [Dysgonamonadaceae bacterium]|nr:leucine-rich repeat domain-containing protein [Dysgonamonadaceae bacterium]